MSSFFAHPALRHYLVGLAAIVTGAFFSGWTESMLPLAMGSAVAVMTTVAFVRAWRQHAAAKREARHEAAAGPGRRRR